jgi:SAM-dependent methyltransferase
MRWTSGVVGGSYPRQVPARTSQTLVDTHAQSLARLGANTLAVDASPDNIRIASRHAAADPCLVDTLVFRHTAVEALVQEPRRFDVVCSMEVIEHVDNPAAFLRSCAELVKVRRPLLPCVARGFKLF